MTRSAFLDDSLRGRNLQAPGARSFRPAPRSSETYRMDEDRTTPGDSVGRGIWVVRSIPPALRQVDALAFEFVRRRNDACCAGSEAGRGRYFEKSTRPANTKSRCYPRHAPEQIKRYICGAILFNLAAGCHGRTRADHRCNPSPPGPAPVAAVTALPLRKSWPVNLGIVCDSTSCSR